MLTVRQWRTRVTGISNGFAKRLQQKSETVQLKTAATVSSPTGLVDPVMMVLSGVVRIEKASDDPGDRTLYHLAAGDICALQHQTGPRAVLAMARAIAETDVHAAFWPRGDFDQLMALSREFRAFVFAACSKQIGTLYQNIEDARFNAVNGHMVQELSRIIDIPMAFRLPH